MVGHQLGGLLAARPAGVPHTVMVHSKPKAHDDIVQRFEVVQRGREQREKTSPLIIMGDRRHRRGVVWFSEVECLVRQDKLASTFGKYQMSFFSHRHRKMDNGPQELSTQLGSSLA